MYTKDGVTQFLEMRLPNISPNGLGSAINMQVFFVNRAGLRLSPWRREQILLSAELLGIELRHLKYQSEDRRVNPRNEEQVLEMLNNELAYVLMAREFKLARQPKPVYPPPPKSKWIGGRNGYNWKGG
jgi:hypothetical protein